MENEKKKNNIVIIKNEDRRIYRESRLESKKE